MYSEVHWALQLKDTIDYWFLNYNSKPLTLESLEEEDWEMLDGYEAAKASCT